MNKVSLLGHYQYVSGSVFLSLRDSSNHMTNLRLAAHARRMCIYIEWLYTDLAIDREHRQKRAPKSKATQ